MPKEVRAYQCNYCYATSLEEQRAIEQEAICLFNPSFNCCDNCTYKKEMKTPKFMGPSEVVQTCQNPIPDDVEFEAPHEYGWCPNYSRNPEFNKVK